MFILSHTVQYSVQCTVQTSITSNLICLVSTSLTEYLVIGPIHRQPHIIQYTVIPLAVYIIQATNQYYHHIQYMFIKSENYDTHASTYCILNYKNYNSEQSNVAIASGVGVIATPSRVFMESEPNFWFGSDFLPFNQIKPVSLKIVFSKIFQN